MPRTVRARPATGTRPPPAKEPLTGTPESVPDDTPPAPGPPADGNGS
jgi:hypothetical protein